MPQGAHRRLPGRWHGIPAADLASALTTFSTADQTGHQQTTMDREDGTMTNVDVVRAIFAGYQTQDRAAAERLIADDFSFTSPQDDHIDRSAYFARCFPTADRFSEQRLLHAMDLDADHVVLAYEYALQTGERYRNTEILAVHDGKVTEIQVFFGGAVR